MATKKKKTIAGLANDCATQLQKLVRLKAADVDGMCECVTCGVKKHWKEMQGGHFIERGKLSTKLMEENINCQCPGCNLFKMKTASGVLAYRRWMVDYHGEGFVRDLEQMATQVKKFSRPELDDMLADLKVQVKMFERLKP